MRCRKQLVRQCGLHGQPDILSGLPASDAIWRSGSRRLRDSLPFSFHTWHEALAWPTASPAFRLSGKHVVFCRTGRFRLFRMRLPLPDRTCSRLPRPHYPLHTPILFHAVQMIRPARPFFRLPCGVQAALPSLRKTYLLFGSGAWPLHLQKRIFPPSACSSGMGFLFLLYGCRFYGCFYPSDLCLFRWNPQYRLFSLSAQVPYQKVPYHVRRNCSVPASFFHV